MSWEAPLADLGSLQGAVSGPRCLTAPLGEEEGAQGQDRPEGQQDRGQRPGPEGDRSPPTGKAQVLSVAFWGGVCTG